MFIRLFLIVILFPLQSCSNTLIGEKLENSFDTNENVIISEKINNKPQKSNEIPKIKSRIKVEREENGKDFGNTIQEKTIANKDRLSQKSSKIVKKTIFNPQPYRIIIRLSGANPAAPAETVTEALRKAGVQFEVEKIERFDGGDLSKDRSLKR
tara:strand:+ start:95 stop:556 length:462 start_codon:yes stop_codon:yes gene_type:complete